MFNGNSMWWPKEWVKKNMPRSGPPLTPLYTVIKKTENYEERAYPHTYWCTCLLHGIDEARPIGYRRLLDYISGYNHRGADGTKGRASIHPVASGYEKFKLSAPVVWNISPRGDVVSVSFYIGMGPKAMQNTNAIRWPPPKPNNASVNLECWPPMTAVVSRFLDESNATWWPPPQPVDRNIHIECWPAMIVYVRQFRGTAMRKDWARETMEMFKYIPRIHKFASYRMHCEYDDAILPPDRRRNEIWLMAIA